MYRKKHTNRAFQRYVCQTNGNVVKFLHTNQKHFTVGDAMAFPIVKMENQTPLPKNLLFPFDDVDPHLM